MSCDESATYLQFCHKPFLDWFKYMDLWTMANNHLLNTFLINITTSRYVSEFTIRLPNVIAGIFYLLVVIKIGQLLSLSRWQALVWLVIIASPVFVIDFFTVARGYGISLTLCFWAIYYLMRFRENNSISYIVFCSLATVAAIYANFTAIHFALSLGIVLCILLWQNKIPLRKSMAILSVYCGLGLLCLLTIFRILLRLKEIGEFKYGTKNIRETIASFGQIVTYDPRNYGSDFQIILGVLFILLGIACLILLLKKQNEKIIIFVWLTACMILFPILFNVFLDAAYPETRKAVLYLPLFGACLFGMLYLIPLQKVRLAICIAMGIFILQHNYRSVNTQCTREWWYDARTKQVAAQIKKTRKVENPKVACNWLFMPALEIYRTVLNPYSKTEIPYNKNIDSSKNFDFYYVMHTDTALLMHKYYIDTTIELPWGQFLLVKK